MLSPKKTKFKKAFRGKISGNETKVIELSFGNFGIKATKSGRVSAKQLETLRRSLVKEIKGRGKIWIRIYPHLSVTAKPAEIRMGKGKGNFNYFCCTINAGRILFELQHIPTTLIKTIFTLSTNKLGLPIKLIQL